MQSPRELRRCLSSLLPNSHPWPSPGGPPAGGGANSETEGGRPSPGGGTAIAISRIVAPPQRSRATRAFSSGDRRGGRPQERPSFSRRTRGAAIRSLIAGRSILAAQAMTASTTSGSGPEGSNPSATVTSSQWCLRSSSMTSKVSRMPLRASRSKATYDAVSGTRSLGAEPDWPKPRAASRLRSGGAETWPARLGVGSNPSVPGLRTSVTTTSNGQVATSDSAPSTASLHRPAVRQDAVQRLPHVILVVGDENARGSRRASQAERGGATLGPPGSPRERARARPFRRLQRRAPRSGPAPRGAPHPAPSPRAPPRAGGAPAAPVSAAAVARALRRGAPPRWRGGGEPGQQWDRPSTLRSRAPPRGRWGRATSSPCAP